MKEFVVVTTFVEEPKLSVTFGSNDITYDAYRDALTCYDNNLAKQVAEAIKYAVDIELEVHGKIINLNKLIGYTCSIDSLGGNLNTKKLVIYKLTNKKVLKPK